MLSGAVGGGEFVKDWARGRLGSAQHLQFVTYDNEHRENRSFVNIFPQNSSN